MPTEVPFLQAGFFFSLLLCFWVLLRIPIAYKRVETNFAERICCVTWPLRGAHSTIMWHVNFKHVIITAFSDSFYGDQPYLCVKG